MRIRSGLGRGPADACRVTLRRGSAVDARGRIRSMYEHLTYEQDGPVTVITLDRPERMNAIGPQTHAELVRAWTRFRDDDDALVAVLTGAASAPSARAVISRPASRATTSCRSTRRSRPPTPAASGPECWALRAGPSCTSRPSPRSTGWPTRAAWSGCAGPTWRWPTSTPPSA